MRTRREAGDGTCKMCIIQSILRTKRCGNICSSTANFPEQLELSCGKNPTCKRTLENDGDCRTITYEAIDFKPTCSRSKRSAESGLLGPHLHRVRRAVAEMTDDQTEVFASQEIRPNGGVVCKTIENLMFKTCSSGQECRDLIQNEGQANKIKFLCQITRMIGSSCQIKEEEKNGCYEFHATQMPGLFRTKNVMN